MTTDLRQALRSRKCSRVRTNSINSRLITCHRASSPEVTSSCYILAESSLLAGSSLVTGSLLADCSIHTTHTCHVDIDAENQAHGGEVQGERHVNLCRQEDMLCAEVEKGGNETE